MEEKQQKKAKLNLFNYLTTTRKENNNKMSHQNKKKNKKEKKAQMRPGVPLR